jgi:hypothetical protein
MAISDLPMETCYFCHQPIVPDQLHFHHLVPVADGGDPVGETVPAHAACHHKWHRDQGHYARWRQMDYAEKMATFGADEVHRLLAHYGRRGWQQLVATKGPGYLQEFHRAGGRARAANGRDARGRFTTVVPCAPLEDPERLREAF